MMTTTTAAATAPLRKIYSMKFESAGNDSEHHKQRSTMKCERETERRYVIKCVWQPVEI